MAGAFKLIIEDDAGHQTVVPFTRDVITIGRKEGNVVRLTERNVSRFHARLAKENGHVLVEDLKSYNGIKVNGDRISGKVVLNDGDTVQIGDYHLALHAQDGAQAAAGAPSAGAPQNPGHRSAAAGGAPAADDDEFAGDTQRWEPPADMAPLSVTALQTQEERPSAISEETSPAPINAMSAPTVEDGRALNAAVNAAPNAATHAATNGGLNGGPAASVHPSDGLPQRKPFVGNHEPTVRQPASPAPVSGVGAAAAARAQAPVLEPIGAETKPDRPAPSAPQLPASPAAVPRTPATISAPKMPVATATAPLSEQTEALRPAPTAGEDLSVPRLFVVNTIFCGSAFRLNSSELVIGRTEENDITIEHRSVSRNHAKVVREGDRVRVLDLSSANGVLVNGDEIEAAVLRSGDIVELGRVKLRFVPINERFSVTPEEIERARIADTVGDDFENENGTGITNPVRNKHGIPRVIAQQSRQNLIMMGAIGAAVVLAVIAMIILVTSAGKEEDETQATPPVALNDPPRAVEPTQADPPRTEPAKLDPPPSDPPRPPGDTPAVAPDEDIGGDDEPAVATDAKATDKPRATTTRKRLDVERALALAVAALEDQRREDAANYAFKVVAASHATDKQRTQACVQLKVAGKKNVKGCPP